MTRIGRKTIRRGKFSLKKNSTNVLVAKNKSSYEQTCAAAFVDCAISLAPPSSLRSRQPVREVSVIHLDGGLLLTAHIGQENIHDGVGGALEFAIAFALRDPGEETVENIASQRVVQEDGQPLDGDPRIAQFIRVIHEHRPDERGSSRRSVGVPRFADFGTVRCLPNGETMEIDRALRADELQDMEGEFFQALLEVQARVVDLCKRLIRFAAKSLDAADEQAALAAKFAIHCALRSAS